MIKIASVTLLLMSSYASAISLYQVGNSFTFDSKPELTASMLGDVLGQPVDLGYHVRGNTTINQMWVDPYQNNVFTTGYDRHHIALPNNEWDYLTLQSFPSLSNPTLGQERDTILSYVSSADSYCNGCSQIIVYGPWAGRSDSAWNQWDAPIIVSDSTPAIYSQHYHDALYDVVSELLPGRTRLASAGRVIRHFRNLIDAGLATFDGVAMLTDTDQLYRDDIHLSGQIGRFIGSTVIQTSILGRSTVGVPIDRTISPYGVTDVSLGGVSDGMAYWAQLIVWEAMINDPRSGVSVITGDYDGDGNVSVGDYYVWREMFGQTNVSRGLPLILADGNGDGIVNTADYVVWRDSFNMVIEIPEPSAIMIVLLIAGFRQRSIDDRSGSC